MTLQELKDIKVRIKQTLSKRNGIGSVDMYAGSDYDLPEPNEAYITSEFGEKSIDLLLNITGSDVNRDNFPELGTGSYKDGPIPEAFNINDINRICDILDSDVDDNITRGGFKGYVNGEYVDLPGGIDNVSGETNQSEVNHCNSSCTGLCMGSCVGMCNGCMGCSGGCSSSCSGSGMNELSSVHSN